jgi:hypothetical protein
VHTRFPSVGSDWFSTGGDWHNEFSRVDGDRLVVDVPRDHGWIDVGIRSDKPVLSIPSTDTTTAPTRLRVTVDPRTTTGVAVVLSAARDGDLWLDAVTHVRVFRLDHGRQRLDITNCHRDELTAEMPLPRNWDGVIDIRPMSRHVEVAAAGQRMGLYSTCVDSRYQLFASIVAYPTKENAPGAFTLTRVETDRVILGTFSPDERWRLLDDADFDPAAVAKQLADELAATDDDAPSFK